jgi:hypothetical protein
MAVEVEHKPQQESAEPVHEEKHFEPKGAFYFVLLMLLGYALYFAFVYFQVFIERGGA